MAGWRRRVIELAMGDEDVAALEAIYRSRSEPASRGERARILLPIGRTHRFSRWACQTAIRSSRKMAEVLYVYREVKPIKETAAAAKQKPSDTVAIVSYDEKRGVQAIANTAPDLPPEPGAHATFARDHQYKRQGTVIPLTADRY
jgi:hypothetical protein